MANIAKIARQSKKLKYSTRYHNRCQICGRPHGFIRLFGLCRLCFRKLAQAGSLPGVKKASW
ncbi:type Z 30S ribosomal protein S14 [Patescibacteria group bacterium]|nr:type Z 30S ribosomal protein S14 [Patescibacteria group bacterium]